MFAKIFHWYGMCTDNNRYLVASFNKFLEFSNIWAGRIPNYKSCSQMDDFRSVFDHFFRYILYIAAGTSAAV